MHDVILNSPDVELNFEESSRVIEYPQGDDEKSIEEFVAEKFRLPQQKGKTKPSATDSNRREYTGEDLLFVHNSRIAETPPSPRGTEFLAKRRIQSAPVKRTPPNVNEKPPLRPLSAMKINKLPALPALNSSSSSTSTTSQQSGSSTPRTPRGTFTVQKLLFHGTDNQVRPIVEPRVKDFSEIAFPKYHFNTIIMLTYQQKYSV